MKHVRVTSFSSHCGCFSSSIVAKKRCDLVLVEVHAQSVHGELLSSLVDFDKILD